MDERIHCTDCIYKYLCTPFEKLLYTKDIEEDEEEKQYQEECKCFIDINEFNNNYTNGNIEHVWQEMSWNKYTDNLFDYIEDN